MIEPSHQKLSIERQCELLSLPRASYYRWLGEDQGESAENLALMTLIDEEYTRRPFYGSRKMRDHLRRQGHKVNRKRVQRLMRLMGLRSVAPTPNTSKPAKAHKVYPYLLGNIEVSRPNQVWATDITYSVPGVQGKQGCLNEPRVYLKYTSKEAGVKLFASMPGCAGVRV